MTRESTFSLWRTALGLLLGLALGGALGTAYLVHELWQRLPSVDHLATYEHARPLRIYARDGTLLAEYGEERREVVPIEQIPLRMRQALLAIEDTSFYEHPGVDFKGIARAAASNLLTGRTGQGASTITMQVARAFFLSREKTYSRKLLEVLLAHKLERNYSKDRILELYMNQVYLGERAYGFAAAASVYFDKTLDELTLAEAAMLAGLPKAPSAYNPVANRERAVQRQRHILQRMHALGMVDQAALQAALDEPLNLRADSRSIEPAAAYAVERVRQQMVERFGDETYTLGLDVTTTLDWPAQQAAAEALRQGLIDAQAARGFEGPEARVPLSDAPPGAAAIRTALRPYPDSGALRAAWVQRASASDGVDVLLRDGTAVHLPPQALPDSARAQMQAKTPDRRAIGPGAIVRVVQEPGRGWRLSQLPRMQGALVSIDVASGEVVSMVGGFDYTLNRFDHATQAQRQPGSTFKPFVWSAALDKGYFPGTLVDDSPREVTPAARGQRAWSPKNYGERYEGFISLRRALARSKNMVAVNLMEAAGVSHVHNFIGRFGFDPDLNPARLPLALGAGATTPLGLAQAYGVFASGGEWTPTTLIREVRTRDGDVLFAAPSAPERVRVLEPRNAYLMDSLLRDVVRTGTARRAMALGRADTAGKTGTSNDSRDVWFAGYSSGLVSVVWAGYDAPRSLGRATGGTLALPIWMQYMKVALQERQPTEWPMPEDLVSYGDDLVYSELVGQPCANDGRPYTRGPFECGATVAPPPGPGLWRFGPR